MQLTLLCFHFRRKGIQQYTKIGFKKIEEHWEPKTEDLDALKVVREIPNMFILLSKDPLEIQDPPAQKPLAEFLDYTGVRTRPPKKKGGRKEMTDLEMLNGKKAKNESNQRRQRQNASKKKEAAKPKENKPPSPDSVDKAKSPSEAKSEISPNVPASPKSPAPMEH